MQHVLLSLHLVSAAPSLFFQYLLSRNENSSIMRLKFFYLRIQIVVVRHLDIVSVNG